MDSERDVIQTYDVLKASVTDGNFIHIPDTREGVRLPIRILPISRTTDAFFKEKKGLHEITRGRTFRVNVIPTTMHSISSLLVSVRHQDASLYDIPITHCGRHAHSSKDGIKEVFSVRKSGTTKHMLGGHVYAWVPVAGSTYFDMSVNCMGLVCGNPGVGNVRRGKAWNLEVMGLLDDSPVYGNAPFQTMSLVRHCNPKSSISEETTTNLEETPANPEETPTDQDPLQINLENDGEPTIDLLLPLVELVEAPPPHTKGTSYPPSGKGAGPSGKGIRIPPTEEMVGIEDGREKMDNAEWEKPDFKNSDDLVEALRLFAPSSPVPSVRSDASTVVIQHNYPTERSIEEYHNYGKEVKTFLEQLVVDQIVYDPSNMPALPHPPTLIVCTSVRKERSWCPSSSSCKVSDCSCDQAQDMLCVFHTYSCRCEKSSGCDPSACSANDFRNCYCEKINEYCEKLINTKDPQLEQWEQVVRNLATEYANLN